jgi:drug/metabolite transporter (DMT)-like permease
MILSASCLSISFLFLKINLAYFDYFFLLFLRFFIPLLMVMGLLTVRWEWKGLLSSTHLTLQLFRCLCVLVAQYGVAFYITQNTLLNATVLLNASPLFIPLMEWMFLGHRPGKSTIVGALLAFLGVILVLNPDRSLFTPLSAIGLLAAIGQAGSQVLYGQRARTEHLLTTLFYLFLFTTLFSGAIFLLRAGSEILKSVQKQTIPYEGLIYAYLLFMAVATLLNQYYRGLAYRCGRPSTLSPFLYFSVFVSALFDWLIFRQTPTLLTVIGGCLILLGGILKIFLRAHILKKRDKK